MPEKKYERNKYGDELHLTLKEKEWKRKPMKSDYKAAKRLLRDFYIETTIPECTSIAELQRFTREAIHNRLT